MVDNNITILKSFFVVLLMTSSKKLYSPKVLRIQHIIVKKASFILLKTSKFMITILLISRVFEIVETHK